MLLPELATDPLPPKAAEWRRAFGTLRPSSPPCGHLGADAWANSHDTCTNFIERFGAEAGRLGWTAAELFGVHPEQRTQRVDWCGAMITDGQKAIDVNYFRGTRGACESPEKRFPQSDRLIFASRSWPSINLGRPFRRSI
ncbi:hypothetical protein [Methylorubrum extorquens]|uniref:hypothetical protein n=1 Tax=Methylorubrum extorquens TaxID=408 RepID=UPI003D818012